MAFQVTWTDPAAADLEGIVQGLNEISEEAATRLGRSILSHVEILSTFPHIGPIYRRDKHRRVREILCGKYRIFYRVIASEDLVEILAVRHGSRRDPDPGRFTGPSD